MVKNLPVYTGDIRDANSIPGLGRSPGGGHDNPLQCSCLENPMDRRAWQATVHRIPKSQTQLKRLSTHVCSPVGFQTLLCMDTARCCLASSGYEVTGCGNLRGPRDSVGSLGGGIRAPKTLGLLPTHWQVKPAPRVTARLLAGKADSLRVWLQGPEIPEVILDCCGEGEVPKTVVYGVLSRVS